MCTRPLAVQFTTRRTSREGIQQPHAERATNIRESLDSTSETLPGVCSPSFHCPAGRPSLQGALAPQAFSLLPVSCLDWLSKHKTWSFCLHPLLSPQQKLLTLHGNTPTCHLRAPAHFMHAFTACQTTPRPPFYSPLQDAQDAPWPGVQAHSSCQFLI